MGNVLLQINVSANVGSTGKIAEQIGLVAIAQGWESYIAYGREANTSKSNLIKVGNKLDILYHGLISRLFDKHGLGSRIATKRLVKKIHQIQPDIIHLHNIHGYYLNYKILFRYLTESNIPVVWTLHDCWSFTGHCAHFITIGCEKWKGLYGCNNCPLSYAYPQSFVDGSKRNFRLKKKFFSSKQNIHIVAVSQWLASFVQNSFFCKNDISVINNGINLQLFKPGAKTKQKKNILGVSNVWTEGKGLYDFYKLREVLPVEQYDIILVGLTPKQILNLPSGIVGIERTKSVEELAKLYSQSDVFVNPTYADSFPTVNMEALACGTPIVTYDTGGSPEIISQETGVVVKQGNITELKDAILTVTNNGKEYYSSACRERANNYFNQEKCFLQYINLYNEIINS